MPEAVSTVSRHAGQAVCPDQEDVVADNSEDRGPDEPRRPDRRGIRSGRSSERPEPQDRRPPTHRETTGEGSPKRGGRGVSTGGDRARQGRGSGGDRDRGRDQRGVGGRGRSRSERPSGARDDRERRPPRVPEPELSDAIEASQLDRSVRQELRTLSKENADGVARHLVATALAMTAADLDRALAHAEAATKRAGRVASVREALGMVHYRRGEWAKALGEFRTARRLSGSHHLLPHMADAERGLGRPERALELADTPEARALPDTDRVELAIVVSGARRDLGQHNAAVQTLRDMAHRTRDHQPWAGRLYYAYADVLLAVGDERSAQEWFGRAVGADPDGMTDAGDRLAELDGVELLDLDEDADAGAVPSAPRTDDPRQ